MNIPKNQKAIENDYNDCVKRGVYTKIDRSLFKEYILRAQKDLVSAQDDLEKESFHWSIIKAYQSLFFIINALLVKYCGYFSKDHKGILTALLKEKVISNNLAKKLGDTLNEISTLNYIDELRLERNKAMYKPEAWRTITKEEANSIIKNIKEIEGEIIALL